MVPTLPSQINVLIVIWATTIAPRIPVMAVIRRITTTLPILTTLLLSFLQPVMIVIQKLHGYLLHGIMIICISRSILENIEMSGINAQSVIRRLVITCFLAV